MIRAVAEFKPDGGCIKALFQTARKRGYVTIEELMECIPPDIVDEDAIDDIVSMMEDMGLKVAR
jgi:RNA polymerase primary sigma factor